ncbi:cytochrome c oxidase subunit II (mitochondrion) [Lycorma delicatula]|uniref:Cytochrome c oxidase subunit 2 n=1 Tax=Lycorma delicatula TaxID=130591 RepID=C5HIK0_LYCDL|nr:cytochrome c oxidase subunit II [Lycorma delicatula]ACF71030.1 cytochrome c oxidase subunit II [Lycorma delicatula]ACJ69445.1 cytochrome c oxidase subunit II [Lycorma delicatula]QGN74307.1 cytochrome c oxidase subunit II [Lycorma delicatula]QPN48295.1 cytochrome c oxidase subunit II [Lycorma delicatula]QPN48308.1 cytochrome c oxidase subunit II [Lycorma delicatula]
MSSLMKFNMINSASPIMEQLLNFHDHTMMILLSITVTVTIMMATMTKNKLSNNMLTENQLMETIWTTMPAIILIFIAIPSIKTLYLMEEVIKPSITIKTIGHQWYWSYEYSDSKKMEFESYMKPQTELPSFRLIEVDNRMVIPFSTQIRMIVSSSDVIHSWTIPSMGVKMDAIPGRLNQISLMTKNPGVFFGQCSEICGMNHSFMPITMESINMKSFIKWMKT